MTWRQKALAFEKVALCVIRKWWRPVTCIWIALTMATHGVVIPIARFIRTGGADTDLMALSALVTAVAAAFAVRTYEKVKGAGSDAA